MKKLGRIHLHNDIVLSDNEMKKVLGGSGSTETSCSASCGNTTIEITNCNGKCEAEDVKYVKCIGKTQTLTKECNGGSGTI